MLGQNQGGDSGLRHIIEETLRKPAQWIKGTAGKGSAKGANIPREFWALNGVSFDVEQGDVVGIIGRNGAGKSTLLKVLSRITEPTRGRIGLKGRVASLLEVGTGFHPELSGRENVFLNGAILGMTHKEIASKFDEIVAFAGVEKFLDTPVKRYSSGMYVRLAFAVAAHLEPEILIIDEVLAVGDSEFQQKCLGKMKEVSSAGRTVLFVSHNLPAVSLLCNRGIYLKSGSVEADGDIENVLKVYRGDFSQREEEAMDPNTRRGTGSHRIVKLKPHQHRFSARESMTFDLQIEQFRDEGPFHFAMHVRDKWDTEVFSIDTAYLETGLLRPGNHQLRMEITSPWLFPGEFRVEAFLHYGGIVDHWPDACRFEVDSDVAKKGYTLDSAGNPAHTLASFHITPFDGVA